MFLHMVKFKKCAGTISVYCKSFGFLRLVRQKTFDDSALEIIVSIFQLIYFRHYIDKVIIWQVNNENSCE